MQHALAYRFNFQSTPDQQHTIVVPLAKLAGRELTLGTVVDVIRTDSHLRQKMLDIQAKFYEGWTNHPAHYSGTMEHLNESISIIEVD